MTNECRVPPSGWYCTRGAGHDGPCAAIPGMSPADKMHQWLDKATEEATSATPPAQVAGSGMGDEEIIAIRDRFLPNQGEPFDTLAFGRAVALAAQPAPVVGGDALRGTAIVAMLVEVARAAHYAMDNSADGLLDEKDRVALSDALDALDVLPEIEDGYIRDGWCLAKDHLAAISARPAVEGGVT